MSNIFFYDTEKGYIVVKKISIAGESNIIFIDKFTDGLNFSYTIKGNFSKKNIESFLTLKFKKFIKIK